MLQFLKRVTGRVLGIIQGASHVSQVRDFPIGGDNNIVKPQPQPAKQEPKRKPKVARATTRVKLPTKDTSPAPTRTKKSSTNGTKRKTPVHQSQPHAKQAAKPKR